MAISKQELDTAIGLILRMDLPELQRVNAVVRQRYDYCVRSAARTFREGQRVAWTGKNGENAGTVIKVNPKMVRVRLDDGGIWNVSGSLLRPVLAEKSVERTEK